MSPSAVRTLDFRGHKEVWPGRTCNLKPVSRLDQVCPRTRHAECGGAGEMVYRSRPIGPSAAARESKTDRLRNLFPSNGLQRFVSRGRNTEEYLEKRRRNAIPNNDLCHGLLADRIRRRGVGCVQRMQRISASCPERPQRRDGAGLSLITRLARSSGAGA